MSIFLPWQKRVLEEKQQLDTKRLLLSSWLGSDATNGLDEETRALMWLQHDTMMLYSTILAKRIYLFNPE